MSNFWTFPGAATTSGHDFEGFLIHIQDNREPNRAKLLIFSEIHSMIKSSSLFLVNRGFLMPGSNFQLKRRGLRLLISFFYLEENGSEPGFKSVTEKNRAWGAEWFFSSVKNQIRARSATFHSIKTISGSDIEIFTLKKTNPRPELIFWDSKNGFRDRSATFDSMKNVSGAGFVFLRLKKTFPDAAKSFWDSKNRLPRSFPAGNQVLTPKSLALHGLSRVRSQWLRLWCAARPDDFRVPSQKLCGFDITVRREFVC